MNLALAGPDDHTSRPPTDTHVTRDIRDVRDVRKGTAMQTAVLEEAYAGLIAAALGH